VTISVVVADDQGMVRSGFSVLLNAQPDIEVIGEACNGREAIDHAAALHPDVILMDVRMPVLDGLQATRTITQLPGAPKILVLTTFEGQRLPAQGRLGPRARRRGPAGGGRRRPARPGCDPAAHRRVRPPGRAQGSHP
jgi:CheY-like chemotaxis protein